MTGSDDRPIGLLDRPAGAMQRARWAAPGGQGSPAVEPVPAASPSPTARPVPRGWGSHEERRLMLWGLAGFFLLGLYAVVFVTLGAVIWG